jgi:hypothetical protein
LSLLTTHTTHSRIVQRFTGNLYIRWLWTTVAPAQDLEMRASVPNPWSTPRQLLSMCGQPRPHVCVPCACVAKLRFRSCWQCMCCLQAAQLPAWGLQTPCPAALQPNRCTHESQDGIKSVPSIYNTINILRYQSSQQSRCLMMEHHKICLL